MLNMISEVQEPLLPQQTAAPPFRRSPSGWTVGTAPAGTTFQTVFNLVNLYLGIALLSMPWALRVGGWLALCALGMACLLFCLSAQLIPRAFALMPEAAPQTYPELGKRAAGKAGSLLVLVFALLELFGNGCVVVLVIWEQLVLLLPPAGLGGFPPLQAAAAIAIACMFPMIFVRHWKGLTWLSMMGLASSVLVTCVVISLVALDPDRAHVLPQPPPPHTLITPGLLQSVGVFALSLSGHSALPSLMNGMERRQDFPKVLWTSFGTMAVVYAAMGAAGYYYFGSSVAPVITTSLAQSSLFSGHALLRVVTVDRCLAAMILFSSVSKYPVYVIVMQDTIISTIFGVEEAPRFRFAVLLRCVIFCGGIATAYAFHEFLGQVVSLVGGFASISCSLLLPTAFYARLAWKGLGWRAKGGLMGLMLLGMALAGSITAQSVAHMVAHKCC